MNSDKQNAGCAGLIIGFFVFGLLGVGIGLFFFNPFQAIGLGIISSVIGAIGTCLVLHQIS